MSGNDPIAACDRLVRIFERAQSLGIKSPAGSDDTIQAPIVPLTIALLKMKVRPALTSRWLESDPVHVVLVGGTNTGKSTLLNLLLGRDVAGMGVQARFSQHPEAYRPSVLGDEWLDGYESRFRGYRRYRNEHPPRQSDEELRGQGYIPALAVIDPQKSTSPEWAPLLSQTAVVWDAPDYSTEVAESYLSTVIDLIGLADLVVMTVTDESYADNRGNAILRMVSEAGVSVVVAANKVPENPSLIKDITRTIETVGQTRAPLLQLREVRGASPSDRLLRLLGTSQAATIRDTIGSELARGRQLKRCALRGSIQFIGRHFEGVLQPLVQEADAATEWSQVVDRVARERILEPYQRDYLEGIHYGEFNRTLVHLVELLRVPVVGPVVETAGQVVRVPFRLARQGIRKLLKLPASDSPGVPEEVVLRTAIGSCLLALASEAQARVSQGGHASWRLVAEKLSDPATNKRVFDQFERDFAAYREGFDIEVRRRAESLYKKLKEEPARLNALRGANLLAGTASVAVAIKTAGISWSDAVIGPVVAGIWHNLLEWGLGRYLETLRADLVTDQFQAVASLVVDRLAEPLKKFFDVAVSPGDLEAALADFAVVKNEAIRVAGGSDA